jgi:L-cysteine S-thiosulfotransferase
MRMRVTATYTTTIAAVLILAGCAATGTGKQDDTEAKAAAMLKQSFVERGQAKLDRLDQDETQRLCTDAGTKPPPKNVAEEIEKINLATIKWPADGKYLGDWKNGEKIAQEGRGMQYSDDPKGPVGANCYACHQLTKEEVSYGTIGPSLYNFGKLRGYSADMQKYAYGKVYNAEAYTACTNMPRFGHKGILSEAQIRDVVALLMDPNSPVNK